MAEADFNELQKIAIKFGEVTEKSAIYLGEAVSIMKDVYNSTNVSKTYEKGV